MKTMLLTAAVLATLGVAPALAASTAPPTDPMNTAPSKDQASTTRETGGGATAMPMKKHTVRKASMHRMHRKPMKKMTKKM